MEKTKIALVTGGAVRVGRALAMALGERGYDLIIHYLTSGESAKSLVDDMSRIGRKVWLIKEDLRERDGVIGLVESTKRITPVLDVLVNSASFFPEPEKIRANNSLLEESWEAWDRALAVNARAPFFLIQELFPLLCNSENPSITNLLDTSVTDVFTSRASHSVSKWALAAVTELAARAVYPPIRVNSLELGRVILSGDELEEASAMPWVSIEDVVSSFVRLVADPLRHGVRERLPLLERSK